jgi:hypothetical protein
MKPRGETMTDELNPQGDEVDYEELRRQMMGSMPTRKQILISADAMNDALDSAKLQMKKEKP